MPRVRRCMPRRCRRPESECLRQQALQSSRCFVTGWVSIRPVTRRSSLAFLHRRSQPMFEYLFFAEPFELKIKVGNGNQCVLWYQANDLRANDRHTVALRFAFEMIKREAQRYGVSIVGSEIVGLVPQHALIAVADFYLQLERFSEEQILEHRLGAAMQEGKG